MWDCSVFCFILISHDLTYFQKEVGWGKITVNKVNFQFQMIKTQFSANFPSCLSHFTWKFPIQIT